MSIDDIKLKRFAAKFGNRPPKQRAEVKVEATEPDPVIEEGAEEPRTPKFVQHCVTAITEKPKVLNKLKQQGASPFAICNSAYSKNKRSLSATHSGGTHHTAAQYERALKKLREDTERAREDSPSRDQIVFDAAPGVPRNEGRRTISFNPE